MLHSIITMTYPFIQLRVELTDRIDEVIHAALGFPTEVVDFRFMGRHTTFFTNPGHIGLLKVQEVFWKGHQ